MDELRRNTNTIFLSETVYEGQAEQGIELDYVLPDYFPEIFKILKCRLIPKILSYTMIGDSKLMLDGSVDIKVLYLAEGDAAVYCIDQHYTYSKTVDIGKNDTADDNYTVKLLPKADYCNCRAVSGRRIDVRGAVSTKIQINSERTCVIPSIPENIQVRSQNILCCDKIINAVKQFTIREEIETGSPGISYIIRSAAFPKVNEVRVISDKAVVKGVITVNATYGSYNQENPGCKEFERMTADIPVSQIIDIEGIDESFSCNAEIDILSCDLSCSNENGIISCIIQTECRVICRHEENVSVPVDAYSTEYECDFSTTKLKTIRGCSSFEKQLSVRSSISSDNGDLESVWDCSSEIYNVICNNNSDNSLVLSGQICHQILAKNTDGNPCYIEKQEPFECEIPASHLSDNSIVSFNARCADTDYSIKSDGTIDINAKLDFTCNICDNISIEMIDKVTVLEDRPVDHDNAYALRIYYANGTEDCWTIAKRYRASVDAIISENEIDNSDMMLSGMVLIPVI